MTGLDDAGEAGDAVRVRGRIRSGEQSGPTHGLAPGRVQANLVMLPSHYADAFEDLCARNPTPCPLVERLARGSVTPRCAPDADLRTDLGRYRVWRDGAIVDRPRDLHACWNDDLVAFLIGCSFGFEAALVRAGLPPRHLDRGSNVPMYRTSVALAAAGPLTGSWVVSMRPYPRSSIERVRAVTRPYREAHGEPAFIGDPLAIGIADLMAPEYGDPPELRADDVPLFWGCGVTPQCVVAQSRLPFAITHEPGAMFVTDLVHAADRD